MIALDPWIRVLGSTKSEEELLQAVQRYCAERPASDLAKIPRELARCSPPLADDIPALALAFKRAELVYVGPEDATSILREMARVFAFASEQLRVFRGRRPMLAWQPHRSYYGPT